MTRVIADECGTTGGVIRRYLENHPKLDEQLTSKNIPIVVLRPDLGFDGPLKDFRERMQEKLNGSVARHGPALYIARIHASHHRSLPLTDLDAGPGVFVGFFIVGEGGGHFYQPSGEIGEDEALFRAAILAVNATQGPFCAHVIDEEDTVTGSVVRDYLKRNPRLDAFLVEHDIPVVVFRPLPWHHFEEAPDFFEHAQTALTAAVSKYGRAVYVATCWAGHVARVRERFQLLEAGPGAFVGYFAVGEGGAVFFQPDGKMSRDPALFETVISAMMQTDR